MKANSIAWYKIVRYWASYPSQLFSGTIEDELVLARLNWVTLGEW
jgi:hypothetical protein